MKTVKNRQGYSIDVLNFEEFVKDVVERQFNSVVQKTCSEVFSKEWNRLALKH